jgi:methyl-accepting chemotaxis protein
MSNLKKITLTVIACFVVALIIICLVTFYHIAEQEEKYINSYQSEEMERIKQSLQNAVDVVYTMIDTHYSNAMERTSLEKHYGQRLVNVIEIAEIMLKAKSEAVKRGELTLLEAQNQAMAEIAKLRYDNGNGFIWINNTTLPSPRMLLHPQIPKDQELDDPKYNRAGNQELNFYQQLVQSIEQHGKGFVIYHWDKPTQDGLIQNVPKLAYGKLFPEWDWILATAIYVDEAIYNVIDNIQHDIRRIRYNHRIGYFWLSNNQKSHLKLLVHPTKPELEGFLEGEARELYSSFVEICENPNGSGFKSYKEAKLNDSSGELREILSYAKLYEPLGWIIGTNAYLDIIDAKIEPKQAEITQDMNSLVIKLVSISILVIIMISILSYVLSHYFPWVSLILKAKANTETKPQPTTEAPTETLIPSTPTVTSLPAGMLPTSDCMKMVQAISRTLIAEQNKVVATALQASRTPQTMEEASPVTRNIKQVIDKLTPSAEELKEVLAINQPPSESLNLGEMNQSTPPEMNQPSTQPVLDTGETEQFQVFNSEKPEQFKPDIVEEKITNNLNRMFGS